MTSVDYPALCNSLTSRLIHQEGVINTIVYLHDSLGLNRIQLIDLYFNSKDLDKIAYELEWEDWDPYEV